MIHTSGPLGIVMSGGGARGAYEAGVLSYVFGSLARKRVPSYKLIAGTSVGAVNGTYMAACAHDPVGGIDRLIDMWTGLALSDVLRFGVLQATSLYKVVLGGSQTAGIFDAKPLGELVARQVSWRDIARNLRSGHLLALTVSTTHVSSGRTVLYVDRARDVALPKRIGANVTVREAHITPPHVLASAAIPLIFPPVWIGDELHCDGGLRLNTPIAPAIQLGAERLLIIAVSTPASAPSLAPGYSPGAPFLLGKVLNAFLLDHVVGDIEELSRINQTLEDVLAVGGPELLAAINERAERRGEPKRRVVGSLTVSPSQDIGRLAGDYLRTHRVRFGRLLGRSLLRLLDVGEGSDADLASYLLFDGDFARMLIDLGRSDAAARRDEFADFLFS